MKPSTVTIGIPAHNEGGNIRNLLLSIVTQKAERFTIKKVIVICDGCTDNTEIAARKLKRKFPILSVINDGKKLGKKKRLQQIYKLNTSDILITFDGDIVLQNRKVIKHMVSEFANQNVGIVSCSTQPIKAENIINSFIIATITLWYEISKQFKKGSNIYTIKGCGLALRRELAKKITFDLSILSDAQFIYFFAKSLGYSYRPARRAIVYYRTPLTLTDYFTQMRRTKPGADKKRLANHFGQSVFEEFKMPTSHKVITLIKLFFHDPWTVSLGLLFKVFSEIVPYNLNQTYNANFWKPVQSTKMRIVL